MLRARQVGRGPQLTLAMERVRRRAEPKVIALTGGIASGKSTVAGMLAELGAVTVDADALSRAAVAPGTPGLALLVASFGAGVLGADGSLDRERLGKLVFSDPVARGRLEAIVHPLVASLSQERIEQALAGGAQVVVYEIPLLFETGRESEFPISVLVYLDAASQLRRLMTRSHLDEVAARARITSQMDLERKRELATWVVDNSGSLSSTRGQVERLWADHLGAPETPPR